MVSRKKYHIVLWIIAILFATNVSTILSFWFHKRAELKQEPEAVVVELPNEQRTRFFREQLDLSFDQVDSFRIYNRAYNREANQITHELEMLRRQMVEEMGKSPLNEGRLNEITQSIGELHTQLKNRTIDYYLQMKSTCTAEQAEKLNNIFISILQKDENVEPPRRMGRGRRWNN